MPVLQIRSEAKCKICASPERSAVDDVLERRSRREEGYNLEASLEKIAALGVVHPTKENITNHWKKHCEVVTEKEFRKRQVDEAVEAAETDERVRGLIASIVGEEYFDQPRVLTPDETLQVVQAAGVYDLIQRVRKGERLGVTVDHLLKSIDGATRRKSNDAATALVTGVGQALGRWAAEKAELESGSQRELPAAEPVEVEYEVVPTDAESGDD